MARLKEEAKQAEAEAQTAKPRRLRPFVIGGVTVVSALGILLLSDPIERRTAQNVPDVTPGRMQVEDEASPAAGGMSGGGASAEAAESAEAERVPIRFYELMESSEPSDLSQEAAIRLRAMPLPPTQDKSLSVEPEAKTASAPQSPSAILAQGSLQDLAREAADAARPEGVEVRPKDVTVKPEGMPAPQAQTETAESETAQKAPESAARVWASEPTPYTLQVASFSKKARAEEMAARLKAKGFEPYVADADLGGKGIWWRVRVGHYSTEQAAKWARLDLVKAGLSPIVVKEPK
ncbi:MAG: SPOR domain-containing protein [Leptospirillia bacterium]